MIRILIVADTPNWAFATRARALQRYAPDDIGVDIHYYNETEYDMVAWGRYDAVFVLPTGQAFKLRRLFRELGISIPIIAGHNSGVGRRWEVLCEALMSCDYTVINNYTCWQDAMLRSDRDRFQACNISNGVDLTKYYVETPISERSHKVLWIASDYKVPDFLQYTRGADDVKRFHRVLWPLSRILTQLPGWDVDFRVMPAGHGLDADQMRAFYNSGSYLVMPSVTEGTPNILLEAMACGCVPITCNVGNVPELVTDGVSGVIVNIPKTIEFWGALKRVRENGDRERLSKGAVEAMSLWDWRDRCEYHYALWREIAAGRRPETFSYMNCSPGAISGPPAYSAVG